jgi:hypothetical protein
MTPVGIRTRTRAKGASRSTGWETKPWGICTWSRCSTAGGTNWRETKPRGIRTLRLKGSISESALLNSCDPLHIRPAPRKEAIREDVTGQGRDFPL